MTRRRPAIGLTLVMALPLAMTGCSVVDSLRSDRTAAPSITAQPVPSDAVGLERFYTQTLTWSRCSGGECATLEVPIDYANPGGETIGISVFRAAASSKNKRIGALVVNPGGPGGSGVDYAKAADFIVGRAVRDAFDIVGFDPRGVGASAPVDCVSDDGLDAWLGGDPTPDDPAERTAYTKSSEQFAADCMANGGPVVRHVSTVEAAKDMDVLRAALGEPKLTYLGKSYGTFLGATYAGLFPTRVGRMVLDGAIAPDLSSEEINAGQAEGFERATRAWAQACVDDGNCPLGGSADEVVRGVADLLRTLDTQPLSTTGDPSIPKLTEGWAAYGIAAAMYDQGMWGTLTDALVAARKGQGADLIELAQRYADRNPGGGYNGNLMEAIYAVNCLDKPEVASIPAHEAAEEKARAKAPTWAPFLMWSSVTCAFWPTQPAPAPAPITAPGAPPIVVVGTTRDPATPYEWAVRLADQLSSGVLLSFDGDGHTAYTRSNRCVDDAIDDFYVKGTVPKDGLTC